MFIKDTINFIKYKHIIKDVLKEEDLLNNLSNVFSSKNHTVKFRTDWIGRIYAVVNPTVLDPEERIFEYDNNGTNVDSFVRKWVIEHMIAADNFVKNHGLFDILVYNIEQLDENYNYLITLTNIAWFDFWKSLKRTLCITGALLIALIVALIIL